MKMSNSQGKSFKRKASSDTIPVTKRAKKGSVEGSKLLKRSGKKQSSSKKKLPESVIAVKNEILRVKKASTGLHAALDSLQNFGEASCGPDIDVFNEAVKESLQVTEIIARLYGVKNGKIMNEKRAEKLWPMIRPFLKSMVILSKSVTEPTALCNVVSNGFLPMLPLYRKLDSLCKTLIKQLAMFWNTSHEKLRIASFLTLYRLSKFCSDQMFEFLTKEMYSTFLHTCKHTSKSTITMINFMRTSIREIYVLNTEIAYKHAFVNIRQLAVLMRSAYAHRTQDNIAMVLHWQFCHSLRLWEEVISMTYPSPRLEKLIYPLTQVSLGVLDLADSSLYYPMRFHILKLLTNLSIHTKSFITIIPHMLKMLEDHKVISPAKDASIQVPIQWDYIFRLNEKQLNNSSFGDQLTNRINEHLLQYLAVFSGSIAFPELASIVVIKLEDFIRKCRVPSRTSTIKATIEVIQKNTVFVESRRNKHAFHIKNDEATNSFEIAAAQAKPPLITAVEKLRKKRPAAEAIFEDETYSLAAVVKDVRQKEKADQESKQRKPRTVTEETDAGEEVADSQWEEQMEVDEDCGDEEAQEEDCGDDEELGSDSADCEEEEEEGDLSFVVQDQTESDVQMLSEDVENVEEESTSTVSSKKKKNKSRRKKKSN